jgi:hypothetical protein
LLIARPGGALNVEGIVWMSLAAACYAIYQIQTRQLSPTENTLTMLFYTALVGTVSMTLAAPLYWGGPTPSLVDADADCLAGDLRRHRPPDADACLSLRGGILSLPLPLWPVDLGRSCWAGLSTIICLTCFPSAACW